MEPTIAKHLILKEITNFLVDRKSRRLSPRTIEYYHDILIAFTRRMNEWEITEIETLTANILREYLAELHETHKPGGVHGYWRTIKTFLGWFELETEIPGWSNPMKKVAPPRVTHNPIPGIPLSDVAAMIATCDKDFMGLRDIAIFRTLLDTGMRREEFRSVRIEDLNMDTGAVKVWGGKGNKDRIVFVNPTTRRDIMKYLRKRNSVDPRDWLFVTLSGTQLAPNGLREIIRRRAIKAGVPQHGPHDFRRTFAIECLRNNMDLVRLMYLMGHTTTTVLQRYLAVREDDLRIAHETHGPLANFHP